MVTLFVINILTLLIKLPDSLILLTINEANIMALVNYFATWINLLLKLMLSLVIFSLLMVR